MPNLAKHRKSNRIKSKKAFVQWLHLKGYPHFGTGWLPAVVEPS